MMYGHAPNASTFSSTATAPFFQATLHAHAATHAPSIQHHVPFSTLPNTARAPRRSRKTAFTARIGASTRGQFLAFHRLLLAAPLPAAVAAASVVEAVRAAEPVAAGSRDHGHWLTFGSNTKRVQEPSASTCLHFNAKQFDKEGKS